MKVSEITGYKLVGDKGVQGPEYMADFAVDQLLTDLRRESLTSQEYGNASARTAEAARSTRGQSGIHPAVIPREPSAIEWVERERRELQKPASV